MLDYRAGGSEGAGRASKSNLSLYHVVIPDYLLSPVPPLAAPPHRPARCRGCVDPLGTPAGLAGRGGAAPRGKSGVSAGVLVSRSAPIRRAGGGGEFE